MTAQGGAVEREDGGGERVGTDHVEDEAGIVAHARQPHEPRQHLRCEVEHGVAVGQVVEVAHEDETAPLRKGRARARLRLVRVGDHLHLDGLAARGTHLRGEERPLLLGDDHRHRARRHRVELDLAQSRLLGCVGVLAQGVAEDSREQRRVVAVRGDEGSARRLAQEVQVDLVRGRIRVRVRVRLRVRVRVRVGLTVSKTSRVLG